MFIVEVKIVDKDKNEYNVEIDPNGEFGYGEANLECDAKDFLKSNSIDELMQLLSDSLYTDLDEDDEEDFVYLEEFIEEVKENIANISDIDTMEIKRIWYARAKEGSDFKHNLDKYANKLPELAEAVCNSSENEKENAVSKLEDYLKTCNICLGLWPTNFCNTKPVAKITYNQLTEDAEEFAEMVVNGDLPEEEYAEETIKIDFANKKIESSADYILREDY